VWVVYFARCFDFLVRFGNSDFLVVVVAQVVLVVEVGYLDFGCNLDLAGYLVPVGCLGLVGSLDLLDRFGYLENLGIHFVQAGVFGCWFELVGYSVDLVGCSFDLDLDDWYHEHFVLPMFRLGRIVAAVPNGPLLGFSCIHYY